jgi:hypothetical protein
VIAPVSLRYVEDRVTRGRYGTASERAEMLVDADGHEYAVRFWRRVLDSAWCPWKRCILTAFGLLFGLLSAPHEPAPDRAAQVQAIAHCELPGEIRRHLTVRQVVRR